MIEDYTKFDDYSLPLESYDGLSKFSSVKRDPENVNIIISADKARHGEVTHSSAEFEKNSTECEGEIELSSGAVRLQTSNAHTGNYVFELNGGATLSYHAKISDYYPVEEGKGYRLSIWQEDDDFSGSPLSVKIQTFGGELLTDENGEYYVDETSFLNEVTLSSVDCDDKQFGNWHQLNYNYSIPGGLTAGGNPAGVLELKVFVSYNGSNYISVDDFRFQPINSTVSSFIYDPETDWVIAKANSYNIAEKYEYFMEDLKLSKIKSVQREVPGNLSNGGFKEVKKFDYNFARK